MTPRSKTREHLDADGESSPPVSHVEPSAGRQRDAHVLSATEDLARVQKLAALGQLAGGVIHDINNLLTVVLCHAELIQEKLPPDSPVLTQVGTIHQAAERASAVARQLLAASRDRTAESSVADVASVIASTQTMLRAALGGHITLDVRCGDALGKIGIQPGRLEQILLNLVVNSRDAMPDGGHLWIVARRESAPRSGCSDWVVLEVTDTGTGIEASALERIFEPFFTTKDAEKGTGLGLWMVRECVSGCDGEITVRSQLGLGTTFEIRLPRLASEAAAVAAREMDAPRASGSYSTL